LRNCDRAVRYLSAQEVWRLHVEVAKQALSLGKPFVPQVRDRGLLEAAINQPRQTFGGADLYPGIFDKAAVLARGIICSHVFIDSNKRTGLLAAAVFLRYNGYILQLSADDTESLALEIAGRRDRRSLEVSEIAKRLESGSKRAP
jgi:death-on-curing protein